KIFDWFSLPFSQLLHRSFELVSTVNHCPPLNVSGGHRSLVGLRFLVLWLGLPALLSSFSVAQSEKMLLPQTESNYQAHPYQGKLEADDGQWIRPAKDYASTRYSTLNQINNGNVKDLKLAFTFSTGLTRGHEAA